MTGASPIPLSVSMKPALTSRSSVNLPGFREKAEFKMVLQSEDNRLRKEASEDNEVASESEIQKLTTDIRTEGMPQVSAPVLPTPQFPHPLLVPTMTGDGDLTSGTCCGSGTRGAHVPRGEKEQPAEGSLRWAVRPAPSEGISAVFDKTALSPQNHDRIERSDSGRASASGVHYGHAVQSLPNPELDFLPERGRVDPGSGVNADFTSVRRKADYQPGSDSGVLISRHADPVQIVDSLGATQAIIEQEKAEPPAVQISRSVMSVLTQSDVPRAAPLTKPVKHLTIRLRPEALGDVSISMTLENETLSIRIAARDEIAASLLRHQSGQLEELLAPLATGDRIPHVVVTDWNEQDSSSNQASGRNLSSGGSHTCLLHSDHQPKSGGGSGYPSPDKNNPSQSRLQRIDAGDEVHMVYRRGYDVIVV